MCKLFAVVEIENQSNAEKFTKKAIPEITKTDNHGLGVMRLGENGVHIQRWLEPPTVVRRKQSASLKKYEKALKRQQNEAGRPSRELHAIAVHGRFATCARTLENVHPFYKDGTALMHNGVISNPLAFTREVSTCDSEALLSQYIEMGVKAHAGKLGRALDGVGGYYAAIAFNNNGTIDIWRDDTASLFLAHVRGVGVVIATTAEIITRTAKKCRAYITGIDEILPFTNIRWRHGTSPQISTFDVVKPVQTFMPSTLAPDVLSTSDAAPMDAATAHWWDLEDMNDKEAQRVAKWQQQEKEDAEAFAKATGSTSYVEKYKAAI